MNKALSKLSREKQHDLLDLRSDVRELLPLSYVKHMLIMFPGKYEDNQRKLNDFINGRFHDKEMEADFRELVNTLKYA